MAFTRVPGFLPSQSGFHFSNSWPADTKYPAITLPVVGTIASGDASNGLCGGFTLAALDLFCHVPRLSPPPDTTQPAGDSTIFNYLSGRLMDSLGSVGQGGSANGARVVEWIHTPGHDVVVQLLSGVGLARRVVQQEWPKIKMDIDSGVPSPLSLVGGPYRDIIDIAGIIDSLHHCHQVLAYAYQLDTTGNLTLLVYDCNDPGNDNSALTMNIAGDPAQTIPIASPAISAKMSGGIDVRGFFRSDYQVHDPSVMLSSGLNPHWTNMGKPQGPKVRGLLGAVTVMDTPNSPSVRPHVFFEGDDYNLWCLWFSSVVNWTNMGKPQGANITGLVGAITVMDTPRSPQRPHLFVAGSDGHIWCRSSDGVSTWIWTNLGKPPAANIRGLLGTVSVKDTPTSAQRPHAFVEGNDYNLWCLWYGGSAWHWTNMGKPQGANITGSVGVVTVMDTPASPQRPHLFVAGSDGHIWCRSSDGVSTWSWANLGKPPAANIRGLLGAVTVKDTPTSAQRPHAFVEGDDYNLWCLWYGGSAWHWTNMSKPQGANITGSVGVVTVRDTPASPQRPHLFVAGSDGHIWCRSTDGVSTWTWANVGKPPAANISGLVGAVTVVDAASSILRPQLFVTGNDGNVWLDRLA